MASTSLEQHRPARPSYRRVLLTFIKNALVREMTFRGNFLITVITRSFWFAAQLTLFGIIYGQVQKINGWTYHQYLAFMATGMMINSIVESFFMPNCANFSELIRTGNLDFALLKPIDTQFLISFEKMDLAMLTQFMMSIGLLYFSLSSIGQPVTAPQVVTYIAYIGVGIAFFYSLMITLASTSIWFGRNQGLYDFWFYITAFARYPRNIYSGSFAGNLLQFSFTFVIPILLVVTVPARIIVDALNGDWRLPVVGGIASVAGLAISRCVFLWSLKSYRSASS